MNQGQFSASDLEYFGGDNSGAGADGGAGTSYGNPNMNVNMNINTHTNTNTFNNASGYPQQQQQQQQQQYYPQQSNMNMNMSMNMGSMSFASTPSNASSSLSLATPLGSMSSSSSSSPFKSSSSSGLSSFFVSSFDDEPPLLEELGINCNEIMMKTVAVSLPFKSPPTLGEENTDLAGPLLFACALGIALLFSGKVQFGYIYGIGLIGVVAIYIIINLMSTEALSIDRTTCILGYSLLPIVLLALANIVFDCRSAIGLLLSAIAVFWCTFNATRSFEKALDMRQQRWLIAYPIVLLYACFALVTVY